jgi:pimeloyl-ACP methyl ester carboxylesterase
MVAPVSFAPVAFVEVAGLRLHFQQWGAPAASRNQSAIVLVHGLGSSSHIWDLVAPILAEGGAQRVVALDQRGHGESDQPDTGYDFGSVVGDLAGFIEALGLTEPSVLVGHSWGASVVLHYAATHAGRTAGVALVDGGTGSPGERWSWEETESRLRPPDLDGMLWSELLERMLRSNGAYADARAEAVGRSLFNVDSAGRVMRRFRIPNHMRVVRAMWEQRPAELLAQIRCPILILPARQSAEASEMNAAKAAAVARAQQIQPRVRVRWFEDTVHDVPLQRPEELAAELLAFEREALEGKSIHATP